ncbi:MAG: FecR domain-containing protein [Stagnimonas sp.]|nr:FecR domain-containing protein [Stagnimonas sp.]
MNDEQSGFDGDGFESDPRRRLLLRALAAGWLVGGTGWAQADTFGAVPRKLPAGRSIFEIDGNVRINGKRARRDTLILPGDVIETGSDGRLVGVVGSDALIVRPQSRVEIGGAAGVARSFFRLVNGAMLSVFGKRDDLYEIRTPVATIGIRGTGVYTEADADKSYVCLCYGTAALTPLSRPEEQKLLTTKHHDAPMFLYRDAVDGRYTQPAPFYNHTDLELMALEALVGRTVPFAVPDDPYAAPRRDY